MRGLILGIAIGWLAFTNEGNGVAKKYYKEILAECKNFCEEKKTPKKEGKYGRKDTLS